MSCKYIILAVAFVIFFPLKNYSLINAQENEAPQAIIRKIEYKGNHRISGNTIRVAIKTNMIDPDAKEFFFVILLL